mmetsp:Transcript_25129/g.100016  ORF Transcript_25129/g.100016 Transcript_25129/m.100016 type:complete len:221 (-) Transcript_25129:582-1244(-)
MSTCFFAPPPPLPDDDDDDNDEPCSMGWVCLTSWPQAPLTSSPIVLRTQHRTSALCTRVWKPATRSSEGRSYGSPGTALYAMRLTIDRAPKACFDNRSASASASASRSLTPPSRMYSIISSGWSALLAFLPMPAATLSAVYSSNAAASASKSWARAAGMIATRCDCVGAWSDSARETRGSSTPNLRIFDAMPTVDTVTRPYPNAKTRSSSSDRHAASTAS